MKLYAFISFYKYKCLVKKFFGGGKRCLFDIKMLNCNYCTCKFICSPGSWLNLLELANPVLVEPHRELMLDQVGDPDLHKFIEIKISNFLKIEMNKKA